MQKKRLKSRKAQLTLFFLIGILLIAAFAFLWYLNTRLAQERLQAPTEKLIADLLKTGAIPYYVGVCLENVSKEGVLLVGKQGGDIYVDQGGPAPSPTRFIPLGSRVTYGISAPFLVNGTVYPHPPGYPGGESRLLQVPGLNFNTEGRFGEVTLRRLCDTYGPNSALARYVFEGGVEGLTHVFCQAPYIYADVLSTQWQLEQFIQKRIVNCTDWEAINEETGYNVTPLGDPNITFRLGVNDVSIDAFIPLEIKVGGREPVYTIGDFHTKLPVRLKRIAELASFLSTYDVYRLNFNLSADNMRTFDQLWDTNIFVKVMTPLKAAGIWEDIVTIEDTASVIDGKNYVYTFARQNRYPALDWIHQLTNWTDFDIVVMENDTIYINPNPPIRIMPDGSNRTYIYDPDEDNLTYYYTGWKETCNEEFNFILGVPDSDCSRKEPTHPSEYFKFPNQGVEVDLLAWPRYFIDYPDGAPRNWTQSDAYQESARNATFIPHHPDIGPHNITVWVCDEAGLCDWQTLKIMVFDYPQLHINGTNPYSDIPYDRASVEDFYRLSSEGTTAYYTPLLGYIFSDAQEPFEYMIDHPQQILDLPRSFLGYERDIRWIWNFTFNRSSLCDTSPCAVSKEHEINLTVPTVDVPPVHHNVTVYQCLPHRNYDNPDWQMWPYNTSEYDPYEASHMCCSLGAEYNVTINVTTDLLYRMVDVPPEDPVGWAYTTIHDEYNLDFSVSAYNLETGEEIAGINEAATDDGMIEIRFPPASLFGMADKEIVITVRKATNPAMYPAWGAWLPPNTICRGGEAMVGSLHQLEKLAEESAGEAVGPTKLDYAGLTVPPGFRPQEIDGYKAWINNIVMMTFSRKCSGDRGNVCSGDAEQLFRTLRPCDDMDTSKGEIESCQGPSNTALHDPKRMTPRTGLCTTDEECGTNGKCFAGRCYDYPADSCKPYGSAGERPITFESAFGLNRTYAPTEEANGTCNPNPTCSDDPNYYDVEQDEGRYYLSSATCDAGYCDYAMSAASQDCWEYNGYTSELKVQRWCNRLAEGQSFFSRYWNCSVTGEPGPRSGGCVQDEFTKADPDTDRTLCEACIDQDATPMHTALGAWVSSTHRCCGDDIGEGGYLYSASGANSAKSASAPESAGMYSASEVVCDDYYGTNPTDITKWIDNDCRYGANCMDGNCYATNELGPSGGYCCGGPGADSSCVGVFENYLAGDLATCGVNKECECTEISSWTSGEGITPETAFEVPLSVFRSPTGFRTCVAPAGVEQKYIKIANSGFWSGSLHASAKIKALSGDPCPALEIWHDGDGTLTEFSIDSSDSIIWFENTGVVDCVVTITIT